MCIHWKGNEFGVTVPANGRLDFGTHGLEKRLKDGMSCERLQNENSLGRSVFSVKAH
jgi:hypothetical protein